MRRYGLLSFLFMCFNAHVVEPRGLFKVDFNELLNSFENSLLEKIERILESDGAFAVTGFSKDYGMAVNHMKDLAPHCLTSKTYPEFEMPDGSFRTTFARSTDQPSEYPDCIREESEVIKNTFDQVEEFISRLITKIAGKENLLWKTTSDSTIKNFSSLIYKEHIHVYRKGEEEADNDYMEEADNDYMEEADNDYMVPFHADNGMLLMITNFKEHPLQLHTKNGELLHTGGIDTKNGELLHTGGIEDDAIIVLMGRGLSHWLHQGTTSKFFPTPHAVPSMRRGRSSRTVFARMKLVPMNAFPYSKTSKMNQNLFKTFFENEENSGSKHELCPKKIPKSLNNLKQFWDNLKTEECDGNTAYCWMNCLELPELCPSSELAHCSNSKNEPCCTHSNSTGDCVSMDPTCHWDCNTNNTSTSRPSFNTTTNNDVPTHRTTTQDHPSNMTTTEYHPSNMTTANNTSTSRPSFNTTTNNDVPTHRTTTQDHPSNMTTTQYHPSNMTTTNNTSTSRPSFNTTTNNDVPTHRTTTQYHPSNMTTTNHVSGCGSSHLKFTAPTLESKLFCYDKGAVDVSSESFVLEAGTTCIYMSEGHMDRGFIIEMFCDGQNWQVNLVHIDH